MQSVPEVQTEQTVRAFSGTLRRISGVVGAGATAEKASMEASGSSRKLVKVRVVVVTVVVLMVSVVGSERRAKGGRHAGMKAD